MAAYIVLGTCVFATPEQRNAVAARSIESATIYSLTPSTRVLNVPPGTNFTNFTVPLDSDDTSVVAGGTYPAVTIAYQHEDQETVAQAAQLIQDELSVQDYIMGSFGTWTDVSG